jgi:hypothetical protein
MIAGEFDYTKVPVADLGDTEECVQLMMWARVCLALLAYPQDQAAWDEFFTAVFAHAVRVARKMPGVDKRRGKWAVERMPKQQQEGRLNAAARLIEVRMRMASIALPLVCESLRLRQGAHREAELEERLRVGRTLTAQIESLRNYQTRKAYDPRESWRHWKDSLPVLHLAMALYARMPGPRALESLLYEPDWVLGVVTQADRSIPLLKTVDFLSDVNFIRLEPVTLEFSPVTDT